MCSLFWVLQFDPTADGHDIGTCNLVSELGAWFEEITAGSITNWNSFGEVCFWLACENIGFEFEVCAYGLHVTYETEKCISAFFIY